MDQSRCLQGARDWNVERPGHKYTSGPGGILVDAGVTRSFKIREAQSIQFRVEAFNLPNHVNPGNPITALNSQQFGQIVSAGDPRIMQLALKYVF